MSDSAKPSARNASQSSPEHGMGNDAAAPAAYIASPQPLHRDPTNAPGPLLLPDFMQQRFRSPSPLRSNDDRRVYDFFDSLISSTEFKADTKQKISFILVCHMAPTLFPYLKAIKQLGNIALIIPKGFQRESAQKIMKKLQDEQDIIGYESFLRPTENLNNPDEIKEIVKKIGLGIIGHYAHGNKFIIIDIGGYFSEIFEQIILGNTPEMKILRKNFIGIVEDTENGHQKYYNVIERLKRREDFATLSPGQKKALNRLYSVARCALKNTEDYNVGKSIVGASEAIIRSDAHTILERMEIAGVIGFGKIGRSIAEHLRQKNLREVIVYDTNILRQMEAHSLGFKVVSRPELIRHSQIIFSATGSRCLKAEDIFYMQHNVFIASCTSADDEFDFSFRYLIHKEQCKKKQGDILKIEIRDRCINLLDDGNAVNFVHGAVNGPYIYSVQGGLILCAINLIQRDKDANKETSEVRDINLQELSREEMQSIAEKWLVCFEQCQSHIDCHSGIYLLKLRTFNIRETFNGVFAYLEQHQYFECEELESIMAALQKILEQKKEISDSKMQNPRLQQHINEVAMQIRHLFDLGMFASINGYIIQLLIKFIEADKVPYKFETDVRYKKEYVKLLFLRTIADLFLSINFQEDWEQSGRSDIAIREILERSFCELTATMSSIQDMNLLSSEEIKDILAYINAFLRVVDIFDEKEVKYFIGRDMINYAAEFGRSWKELITRESLKLT